MSSCNWPNVKELCMYIRDEVLQQQHTAAASLTYISALHSNKFFMMYKPFIGINAKRLWCVMALYVSCVP